MARFLITYHGMAYPDIEFAAASRALLRKWVDEKLSGELVDFGAPLFLAGQIAAGEPADSVEIDGYSIVQARSVDALRTLLADHPYLQRGGTIQINECLEV